MPTRVLLLRHAQTATPQLIHGAESDVALGERGILQARAIAPFLANYHPSAVISSAMRRARETALPIAEACERELLIEPHLHERRMGAISGTPGVQVTHVWKETLRQWQAGNTAYAPEGTESHDDILRRVKPIWDRLTATWADQTIVVIAHGMVIKVLLISLLDHLTLDRWDEIGSIRNVGVNELVRETPDGPWKALRFNEIIDAVAKV